MNEINDGWAGIAMRSVSLCLHVLHVATRAAINVGDSTVFAGSSAAGVVVAVTLDFPGSGTKRHSPVTAADGDSVGRSTATTAMPLTT
ncbi:hypothetical protein [Xanthomonas axonopodis]|uniref:hypothetical protein n=1 Tax=Xanthomonas axonopodis TaxID=53413 RepID=UPI001071E1CD|nr:hypothetical protein [Xanthomonas axonopodis]